MSRSPQLSLLLFFFFVFPRGAEAEAGLQEALDSLPDRSLKLELVMRKALAGASSFRAIGAERERSEALASLSGSPHDWTIFSSARVARSELEPASPFSPSGTISRDWSVGLRRFFRSGSSVELAVKGVFSDLRYAGAVLPASKNHEHTLSLLVRQSLWADSFGLATRALARALDSQSLAQQAAYEDGRESWAVQVIEQYYGAWLAQSSLRSARDFLERRERLLAVMRAKARNGTAERPELLQVESAALLARNGVTQASAALDQTWRGLVIGLGLPASWLGLPPDRIPIELGGSPGESNAACSVDPRPEASHAFLRASHRLAAAEQGMIRARSLRNPKLELLAGYQSNGLDARAPRSRSEALAGEHPAWSAQLLFEMPLGFAEARGKQLEAAAELTQARAGLEDLRAVKELELRRACADFRSQREELERVREAVSRQQDRLDLEERRFRLGRVGTQQVIQAGDDRASVIQARDRLESSTRLSAWRVLRASSRLAAYLSSWEKP